MLLAFVQGALDTKSNFHRLPGKVNPVILILPMRKQRFHSKKVRNLPEVIKVGNGRAEVTES